MSGGEATSLYGVDKEFMPVVGSIFCQKIFGSLESGVCTCGVFHKNYRSLEIKCTKCGMRPTDSSARRERWGHVELAIPVVHRWFKPYISSLLDILPKTLDAVVLYNLYLLLTLLRKISRNSCRLRIAYFCQRLFGSVGSDVCTELPQKPIFASISCNCFCNPSPQ